MKTQKNYKGQPPKIGPLKKENLQKIQIHNLPWFDHLLFEFLPKRRIRITVVFHTNERDTGAQTRVKSWAEYSKSVFKNNNVLLKKVRALAKHAVSHEIDECLLFGGKRVFDPHKY